MAQGKSSAKTPPKAKTLEVPKVINVRVADGIVQTMDGFGTPLHMLFKHLHDSLNDKNDVTALKSLASAHGYDVSVEE